MCKPIPRPAGKPLSRAGLALLLFALLAAGPVRAADVPPPPGIDAAAVTPKQADELQRASTLLDDALKRIERPDYLPADDAEPTDAEPRSVAQRAYARARHLLRDGQAREAIAHLEAALRFAPKSAPILRMLGRLYSQGGNRVKGAFYFQRAIESNPNDVPSLLGLGLYEFERRRFSNAVATLAFARGKAVAANDADTLLLIRHYMGLALAQLGYEAAAIDTLRDYLDSPAPVGQPRSMRALFIQRGRRTTWQSIGDAYCRLDRFEDAIDAYRKVEAVNADAARDLAARMVYCQLRQQRPEAARGVLLDLLGNHAINEAALKLVSYATTNGVSAKAVASELRKRYKGNNKSPQLALAVAQLLPPTEAIAVLRDHVVANPTDRDVLRRMLDLAAEDGSAKALGAAVATVGDVIDAMPAVAERYSALLIERASPLDRLLNAIDALPAATKAKPAVRYLNGTVLQGVGRHPEAVEAYTQALKDRNDLIAARASLVRLLVVLDRFDEAQKALEPLKDRNEPSIIALRVRVLAASNREAEALRLLETAIAKQPTNIDLIFQRADLQVRLKDGHAAEQTLLEALDAQPREERLYERLLTLYDLRVVPNSQALQQRLRLRLVRELPNSRLARRERAKALFDAGQFAGAVTAFNALIDEDPRDYEALRYLAYSHYQLGQPQRALRVVNQQVRDHGDDDNLLLVADGIRLAFAQAFMARGEARQAFEMLSAALEGPSAVPDQLMQALGEAMIDLGIENEIDNTARKAIAKHPKHEADILFRWAMLYDRQHERDRAERILLGLLEKHPKHAAANNSLGYTWADAGRNLERAEEMIKVAVAAEPEAAAYTDSLGWVQYKLGKFDDATRNLTKATNLPGGDHPVIVDHLGDALYRTGRKDEALQQWREAATALAELRRRDRQDVENDPELAGLDGRLRAKIQAVDQGQPAPVAASKTDANPKPE